MSEIFKEAIDNFLGPIKDLLDNDKISEVMINGPQEIFVEEKGLVYRVPNKFSDESTLMAAVTAIAQSVGRVIDNDNPRLDARLPDGSRIHVVLPPMSSKGTTVAIRKFSKEKLNLKDLINFGSLSKDGARFLDICVHLGKNIIVSGGTGSGKTSMLNVLGTRMPKTQRLIIIEDAKELQIQAEHVVQFEARADNPERGIKGVTIRDLVKSAMRLRPLPQVWLKNEVFTLLRIGAGSYGWHEKRRNSVKPRCVSHATVAIEKQATIAWRTPLTGKSEAAQELTSEAYGVPKVFALVIAVAVLSSWLFIARLPHTINTRETLARYPSGMRIQIHCVYEGKFGDVQRVSFDGQTLRVSPTEGSIRMSVGNEYRVTGILRHSNLDLAFTRIESAKISDLNERR